MWINLREKDLPMTCRSVNKLIILIQTMQRTSVTTIDNQALEIMSVFSAHEPVDITFLVFAGNILPLVVEFLPLCDGDFHLGFAVF